MTDEVFAFNFFLAVKVTVIFLVAVLYEFIG
jgi:hypothetical protein